MASVVSPRHAELSPDDLRRRCDPSIFTFNTSDELPELTDVLGQDRALEAIRFAIGVQRPGYNLYAMGAPGLGKHTVVRRYVEETAAQQAAPADWCYVHNFQKPHRPRALKLPAGQGREFRKDMERLVEDLRNAIPAAFETDEYRAGVQKLEAEFAARHEKAFAEFRERAAEKNVGLVTTQDGLALLPLREGQVSDLEVLEKLPESERKQIQDALNEFGEELEKLLREVPRWRREIRRKVRELNRIVTRGAVTVLIDDVKREFESVEAVGAYLDEVRDDVIEHSDEFRRPREGERPTLFGIAIPQPDGEAALRNYRVNVIVDHADSKGAPVVLEDNPGHDALVGRIEHLPHLGALVTDYTLIRPGALHRANGGYLLLDARKVLEQPYAWEALKRALRSRQIKIESLGEEMSLVRTISLEPEPIPLDVKVLLVGERLLYQLLHQFDPDFPELFKVGADFAEDMSRGPREMELYARLVSTVARRESLRPLDRTGMALVIEHSSRLASDSQKLLARTRTIADLLREADYWAGQAGRAVVTVDDVQHAVDAQEHRSDRMRERFQEEIGRGTILIATQGEHVGQVNGLSVIELGGFVFGHPSRITARVRMGTGRVADIEREVELGGPLHSKGVLILGGYLAGRFVPDRPLCLAASLVFEQSYGGVEGDSASVAELCALLSALADAPVRQSLAVTGSVNQWGDVQAIGGVNEKIEGFFDVCRQRGLTGDQGVIIPVSNVPHLVLRKDVVAAVREGRFHVHAISRVEEGIELLTGCVAGERGPDGAFPAGSVYGRVEARLTAFAESARAFRCAPQIADRGPAT